MRKRAMGSALLACGVMAAMFVVSPASASVIGTDPPRAVTLYMHSLGPVSTVEGAGPLANLETSPSMDETAPGPGAPKVAPLGPGNPNFRKNFLLSFWSAGVHGHVTDVVVAVYMAASANGKVTATLFGDGITGVGGVAGSATALVAAGQTEAVIIQIPGVNVHVDKEIVLSLDADIEGGAALYDSAATPTSLSFTLGLYNPPPPIPLPAAAAGWGDVKLVNGLKAQRETSLAVDPSDEARMLICDPSGVPAIDEGHSYYYLSTDTGASWRSLDNEAGAGPDTRKFAFEGGDCDVAFDAAGTMYTADTWLGDLSVGASRDGGTTWTGTAVAATAAIVDRPWLVGGPAGTAHIAYHDVQFAMPSAIWYTRTADYGQTFRPAALIATVGPEGAFSWEGNLEVAPGGQDLYLVYTKRMTPVVLGGLDDSGPETVWVAASHDGGVTWTQNLVASMPNPASYLYPSIALDKGGMLHVVFASRTATDRPIWYTVSDDLALTWSAPTKLVSGETGYAPWVAGGARGQAVVQWLGSPNPAAALNADEDWYISVARITGADTATPAIATGRTTQTPLFRGKQGAIPEFNMVRLDSAGRMRIGASIMGSNGSGGVGWTIYYQSEA